MIPQGPEVALRAVGTALAGLSIAFAGYMLVYGGGRIRINGVEHLAIFAQPRGSRAAAKAPVLPSLADARRALDMTTTGSIDLSGRPPAKRPPVELIGARADRVWLRIGGVIRAAVPGDDVPLIGRISAIAPRDDGWVVLGAKGETLLTVSNRANGAALFGRQRIFE